jgi:Tol biopolymer transport system component
VRRIVLTVAALVGAAATAGPAVAAFPGLNGVIAMDRNGQIVVKNPGDLGGGTPLAGGTTGTNSDPAWSADGLRLAFVSDRGGSPAIWTMNADGSGAAQFSVGAGDASEPAWSPDGTRIAYAVNNGTDEDVVVQPLSGGLRLTVAGGAGDQDLPVFTPDGTRVVFNDDSVGGLSIVGATGAGRAPFLADAVQADFSPDGTRIIVSRTDIQRLQIVNADGTGGTSVLDGRPAARPVWSPDGTRILYSRFVSSGPPPNYDLFTVSAAGGGAETAEATAAGLDFSPDWRPIGPVPVIRGFPVPLVAGAPSATLTVDGTGFVPRSVVRWNGSNRPTSWVSPTRVTAALTAADVAAPGSVPVTVFTSPSGGGLSAPVNAVVPAPPPPPPRILIGTSRLSKLTWTRSRLRGTLRVTGTLERAGRVEVALLKGRRVAQRRVLNLPAGAFTRTVPLSRTLVPGAYTLRMIEAGAAPGGGAALVGTTRVVRIPAPPTGVVATSFVSAIQNGPPARTLRGKSRIFATFRFAALPKNGRRVTTRWFGPGGISTRADGKPRRRVVSSFVGLAGGLPAGTWRCELLAGGTIVAVASVRLR